MEVMLGCIQAIHDFWGDQVKQEGFGLGNRD